VLYDCATCDTGRRATLGHDGPPQSLYRENLVSGITLEECPLRTLLRGAERDPLLTSEIDRHADEYFPAYEAGYLLVAGGLSEQPARYLDYMNTLTDLRARQQREFDKIAAQDDAPPPQGAER
jgi:hypothetical protein